jgi:hypothetical protein
MSRSLRILRVVLFKRRGKRQPRSLKEAVRFSLLQQLLILGFTSMILDGGVLCCICLYAAIGFWTGVVIIRLRRPIPTTGDLAFIRVGYLPLCMIAFFCAGISHM